MKQDILIEAFLFYKAVPQAKKAVATALGITLEELEAQLPILRSRLEGGATTLIETSNEIQLTTSPEVTPFLEAVRRDELRTDIGKAGAETLAIILYKEPVPRSEIDKIRGVNSSVTLRNLLTRGLITRSNKATAQGYIYTITPQLLAHLGITKKQDLPDYGTILDRMETFVTTAETNE